MIRYLLSLGLCVMVTADSEVTAIDHLHWFAGNGVKIDSSVMMYASILKVYE